MKDRSRVICERFEGATAKVNLGSKEAFESLFLFISNAFLLARK